MKGLIILYLFLISASLSASNGDTIDYDTLNLSGKQYISSLVFKNRFLHNNFKQYIDDYQEFVIYQTETTGDISQLDLTTFSILGNSHKWNKFYYNDFRIDDSFFSGNPLYDFNLYNNGFELDIWNSSINFETDKNIENSVNFRWNHGGIGGPAPFTPNLIHLFHRTAREAMYIDIEHQRQLKNAGTIWADFNIQHKNKLLKQSVSLNLGQRMNVGFNYGGVNDFYPENYTQMSLFGDLPNLLNRIFDSNHYLLSFSSRDYLFNEYYYAKNEASTYKNLNASVYGTKQTENYKYTSGFSFSSKNIRHHDLNFSRNFIDQDGEGVEPWYPDADIKEFAHSLKYDKKLNKAFSIYFDSYNRIIDFKPSVNNFTNSVYYQLSESDYKSLYVYEWTTNQFLSGLLENTAGVKFYEKFNKQKTSISLNSDATLDGMLIAEKSIVRPNWQIEFSLNHKPSKKFNIALNIGKKRVSFNYDHIRFLSNDYLSGHISYWNDANQDFEYQTGEKSDFFTSTGGKYHSLTKGIKQPGVFYFEIPVKFTFGKHNIVLYNLYKKFFNQWSVYYADEEDGYYLPNEEQMIFFLNNGVQNYVVDYFDSEFMNSVNENTSILFDSPFYAGNTAKYQYNGKRFLLSASWTSYMIVGFGAFGNGVLHNNIDVLSESSPNPNLAYKRVGRLDSDRSYIARLVLTYKFSDKLSLAFQFKYKDGQSFTANHTMISSNGVNNQIAAWSMRTKGDNPFTGDFGTRKDAFFNTIIRIVYNGKINENEFSLNASMYNFYDFGTDLAEYIYPPDYSTERYVLELNTPRGIILSFSYKF
ncbi:MAG TPA: hypothetical protein DDX39_12455 [Bacteroidales bacterium]|nr:MAG: hypothetical protein A2W98_11860 [Bacteroidetes bacterium GWF2_33_38]OFY76465.1 MAG: hypothetical protein A2265_07000 [Bacteroidetes bacterium RIFOXYA12_FULL_33_9]OFY85140.1 MAG: hypothetical protein A2236_12260 [Bacteroidetes bacterium RIFOXYA2_FULL_33_7]HBF89444.1 hypothetical protein [Bacteroidales bacterium]